MKPTNQTPFSNANAEASKRKVINNDAPRHEQQKVYTADRALKSVVSFGRIDKADGSVNIDFDAISGFSRFNKR
jgi:hypothetical protein